MSHTGSWVWDVHSGAPVYWSAEMCRIHGRDAAQGPPSVDEYRALLQPEDWSSWLAVVQKSIRDRTEIDFDCRLDLPNGVVKYIRTRGHPIVGAAEQVTEIIGSTAEITERLQLRIAHIQTPDDPSRQLIDLIPALAWSCRPDGTADFFNRGWLEFTGLLEHEALNWGWTAAFHPDDVNTVVAYWQSLLARAEPGEIEARLRCFDGEYRWFLFRARPQRDDLGKVIKWYGTNTDIEDRKQAEESLRESERQLHQLVEAIPALIWRGTAEGDLDYLNQRHIDFLGQTVENLSGGRWLDLVHPDHRDATVERWLHSARSGSSYEDIYRLRRADGQYRWIQSVGEPLCDSEGRITRWYGLITDIDDRKRAEDALRESELNFRLIVDTIPALVCTMTAEGEVELVNQQVLAYFGKTLEQLKDWAFIGAAHEDDLDGVIAKWRHSVETGHPYDIEHRIRRADGIFRWFRVRGRPLRDKEEHIIRWYILLTDIEDGKRSQEAVRASEARFRLITETIPAIVTSRDAEGKLDYVNQQLVDYTGKSVQEILDSGVDLIHPDDRDSLLGVWRSSQESGERYELDYRMRRADGAYRWFRVRGAPLRDREGRVLRWYAVINDIDDGKRAREALLKSQTRLARMSQIMTVAELSASIAHEVNQPLAAVLANAHACLTWLSGDPPNLERALATAERIIRDTNTAAEVVRRMRALFKQAPPAMVLSDINDTIGEVLKLIGNEIGDSDITVETELAAGLPMIVVDRVQIQHALINLAHNGIEAMQGVTDRTRILSLISRRDGVDILIEVRDSGCGIANPASIFDPFFTTKENGMGMGLAICRSIIEVHGGRLWATANEGAGTTFSFTLPLHPDVSV